MKILFVASGARDDATSRGLLLECLEGHEVAFFHFDEKAWEASIDGYIDACRKDAFDLVIVWRFEALAFAALALSRPTVIIPTFGDSGSRPDKHWNALSNASILNFSYNIDLRTRPFISDGLLVKYFPNPDDFRLCEPGDAPHLVIRPDRAREADVEAVLRRVSGGDGRVPVHMALAGDDAPDDLMRQFDVAVCLGTPAGFGTGLVEAMARGMCVLASNGPVHNEYICHGVNGYLLDAEASEAIDLGLRREMGANARKTVVSGYAGWKRDVVEIKRFLAASPARFQPPAYTLADARHLIGLFFEDRALYDQALPEVVVGSRRAGDDTGQCLSSIVDTVPLGGHRVRLGGFDAFRAYVNLIPGWGYAKTLVSSDLKQRLARLIIK